MAQIKVEDIRSLSSEAESELFKIMNPVKTEPLDPEEQLQASAIQFENATAVHSIDVLKIMNPVKTEPLDPEEQQLQASVVQFENATTVHSIDVRNEQSAIVKVLVGKPVSNCPAVWVSVLKRKHDDDVSQMSLPIPVKKNEVLIAHVKQEKVDGENTEGANEHSKGVTLPVSEVTVSAETGIASSSTEKSHAVKQEVHKVKKEVREVKQEAQNEKKSRSDVMKEVVFVISGFLNPQRSIIRNRALEMGAKYKVDWDSTCTHLVCAFVNTPKYVVARSRNGRIVTKSWIYDCYARKELLPWRNYALDAYSKSLPSSSEDESDEEIEVELIKVVKKAKTS